MNPRSARKRAGTTLSVFAIVAMSVGMYAVPTVLAANPSASLAQCANDPAPSSNLDGCNSNANQWVNGNVGSSKANYKEGDSLPYRLVFDNLSLNSHTVTIEWDTTKGGTHALDYITTFNRTVANADPCLGISGCTSSTTFPIPADPQVTGAGVTPADGNFTLYGGTITAVSAYSYANGTGFSGDKSARLTITFTASKVNPVLAWGGHIATRLDWGAGGSAVAISGSPYHTRLVSLDGSGGNQDRSLSADSVTFPGFIHIVKNTLPAGQDGTFNFTASPSPLTNFAITTASGTGHNDFDNITNFTTYTVAETAQSGWAVTGLACSVLSPNGGSQTPNSPTVTINLKEGEQVTCTYTNTKQNPHLAITKVATESGFSKLGDVIHYTITATNDGNTTLAAVTVTDSQVSNLSCTPANGSSLAAGASLSCTASHTIVQADLDAGTFYNQACVDDGTGGAASQCNDVTTPGTKNNVLSLTKTDNLNPTKYDHVGQIITYTLTATNDGNTTLHSVTVSDNPVLTGFACTPTIPVASLAPGGSIVCTGTHSITQADLDNKSFKDTGSASSTEDAAPDADDTVNAKNQPGIATTPTLIPQDRIVLSGLTGASTGGDLYVELQVDASCGAANPAYSKTWTGAGNGTFNTVNAVAIGADHTIRWCTSYSGDANNAARALADDNEVVSINFYPLTGAAIGAGFAIPMLLLGLWNRKRRDSEAS
jgi:uncharacterized repeat protein (TIGR01451 family)